MTDKSPREHVPNVLAGPPTCNLSGIYQLLRKFYDALVVCCNNETTDFNGTFTVLSEFENTLTQCCATIANDFNGTFSALYELDSTLTQCCAEIFTEFSGTFSALAYAFNSTYSVLDAGFGVIIPLSNELDTVVGEMNGTFDACCTSLEFQIANCCDDLINLLNEANNNFITTYETINNIISSYEDLTNCTLNTAFEFNTC